MSPSLSHPLAPRPEATGLETRTFTVTFTTPAFLGGANQSAQWRTPPFKALLREWWRVVYFAQMSRVGASVGRAHEPLREREAELFGNAWLKNAKGEVAPTRSLVRLRLSSWPGGSEWDHTEAGKGPRITVQPEPNGFSAFIYLAFGPLSTKRNQATRINEFLTRPALMPGREVALEITAPTAEWPNLTAALVYVHRFGTVGSRSRNGWGSVALSPLPTSQDGGAARNWLDCLALDWPHALGADNRGPLCWKSKQTFTDWRAAMVGLARLRKQINLSVANERGELSERHVLSDPVTKNSMPAGGDQKRLASQVRFKVAPEGKLLRGWALHVPCGTPNEIGEGEMRSLEISAWPKVHATLDSNWERTV